MFVPARVPEAAPDDLRWTIMHGDTTRTLDLRYLFYRSNWRPSQIYKNGCMRAMRDNEYDIHIPLVIFLLDACEKDSTANLYG